MSYIRYAVINPTTGDILNTGMCSSSELDIQANAFPGCTATELPMESGAPVRSWSHKLIPNVEVGEVAETSALGVKRGKNQPAVVGVIALKTNPYTPEEEIPIDPPLEA